MSPGSQLAGDLGHPHFGGNQRSTLCYGGSQRSITAWHLSPCRSFLRAEFRSLQPCRALCLPACLPFSVPSCFPVRITPSHTQPLGVAAQYCPVRMKYIYIPRKVDPSGPKVCYTASHLRVVRPAYYQAHRSRANCLPGSLASESEVPLVPVSTSPVSVSVFP